MKEKKSSNKLIIGMIIMVLVVFLAYFYSRGTPTTDGDSLLEGSIDPETVEAQIAGERVLTLLNQLNSLKLDTSIFENKSYRSLVDYTIAIPEQNIGRANPFAPVR